MINLDEFIHDFPETLATLKPECWLINLILPEILPRIISHLGEAYRLTDGVAVHKTATIEKGAVVKAPAIIGHRNFIAAGSYLRGGVYLGDDVIIGPGCEVKTSIVMHRSHVAHFNFIGDSFIGNEVNFEAGAIICNHWNERKRKEIELAYQSHIIKTAIEKFWSHCRRQIKNWCKCRSKPRYSPSQKHNCKKIGTD